MNKKKQPLVYYLILSCFLIGTTTALQLRRPRQNASAAHYRQEPQPTPMMGRFAVPEMPENPTQIDVGENLYFYHCMPCHGDHGQGLTDEFREAWVEDHQNCWARGCHTGRPEDDGFPIPKYVPPVIASDALAHFPAARNLFDYLSNEHPPQNPGILDEGEYWALTAFIWFENGRLESGVDLGFEEADLASPATTSQSPVESRPVREIEPQEILHTEPAAEPSSGLNLFLIGLGLLGLLGLLLLLILVVWRKMNANP